MIDTVTSELKVLNKMAGDFSFKTVSNKGKENFLRYFYILLRSCLFHCEQDLIERILQSTCSLGTDLFSSSKTL